MSDTTNQPQDLLARFKALPTDSVPKTIFIAVTLCLFASMIVSATAVALRPVQEINKLIDKQANILKVAGLYEDGIDVGEAFGQFEPHVVELASGEFVDDRFDPETFDDRAAASDPELSVALSDDPAGIGRQSLYSTIYLLRKADGSLDKVILPIKGYGLWSTMYGFISLEANGNDIFGLQFYEHGETPGLGAEVTNPRWTALWNGKKVADENGVIQITVDKAVPAAGPEFFVDAIAGATLTSRGVDNLVKFWLGEEGFGPFLAKLNAVEI